MTLARVIVILAAFACIAAGPDNFRAKPIYGHSGDELILLPSNEDHSSQQVQGQPYLPLVAACANADPQDVKRRRARYAIWEYSEGAGIPAPSLADNFVARANQAEVGAAEPYTLVMIIGEKRGAPSGRYTNKALVYSTTFHYCLFDMPEKTLSGKADFIAHPPDAIGRHATTYEELRRKLAAFLAALPAVTP